MGETISQPIVYDTQVRLKMIAKLAVDIMFLIPPWLIQIDIEDIRKPALEEPGSQRIEML